ncbi:hypothetical protein HO133_004936 [Letharia lupina]|uniref:Uncharacterized protein n=1 Tax=Letharia lupina TaxID=560253 RepID=A0A8H6F8P9_9LECA|nr:uncharacterized protein HO133_004936 [Letharia lupina]KAF6219111.1 hypothetical protein HO133_004936 [Letharia lupina]
MSRIPYFSNELSPWPRIHLGEVPANATAVDQQATFPRLRRGSSQRSGSTPSSVRLRGRASSDAGPAPAKSQVRGRSTSFGSTQEYEDVYRSAPVQQFDRKVSYRKVQELLTLRKQKLKEAERKGDEVGVFRLKNLNLFDDIEGLKIEDDEPKEVKFCGNSTGQPDHHNSTSHVDVLDFGFTPQPKSVSQGHTPTLCWHLKLQYTQGLTVPDEFSQCDIHPTPSPCAFSSSSLSLQSASPSSLSSGSRRSLRHTKVSSIGSSTLRDSSEPSSPATWSSKAIISEPTSPIKDPSIALNSSEPSFPAEDSPSAPNPDEEDPFLYIANYIKKHAQGDRQFKEARQSRPQASSADARRSIHIRCTCINHNCRTYLRGPPSKHCRFCKLPRQQPAIAAAVDRIEEMKRSVLAQGDAGSSAEEPSEADEFRKFEAFQEEMKLVEMYNAETEKRCRSGVWWEGWLIVQDLNRQGIAGSKPFVYERDG